MADYLDTSAFIKLIRSEPESRALRATMDPARPLVASALVLVEGRRAAARYGSIALERARAALSAITLLPIDDVTLEIAADLKPVELRSLDAVHLATARGLGDDLGRFYCYDTRLAAAAETLGISVHAPA